MWCEFWFHTKTKFLEFCVFKSFAMETPERLENCPPTPEEVLEGSSSYLEEARVAKLKLQELNTCVICYSSCRDKSFPECCLHIFCFECLCKWSKQKNQCPLCKKGECPRKVEKWSRTFLTKSNMVERFLKLQFDIFFCHFSFRHHHSQCEIKDWIRPVSGDCSESRAFRLAHKSQRPGDSHSHRAELCFSSCEFPHHTTLATPKIHLQNTLRSDTRTKWEDSGAVRGTFGRLLKIDTSRMATIHLRQKLVCASAAWFRGTTQRMQRGVLQVKWETMMKWETMVK